MIYLFSVLSVVMPVFFIERRQRVDDGQTLFLKCLSTFLMLFLAVIKAYTYKSEPLYFLMTAGALSLCLLGDFFLGYCHVIGKENRLYNPLRFSGMLVFLLAHVVFIVNYLLHTENFIWYLVIVPFAITAIFFVLSPHLGFKWSHKAFIVISALYLITISFMLITGIFYAVQLVSSGATARGAMIIAASILFFISDSILAFMYFAGKKSKAISIANLTTYFASLILLALVS